jgi:hypothetical protein
MQRESPNLGGEFRLIEQTYGADHLDLVLAKGIWPSSSATNASRAIGAATQRNILGVHSDRWSTIATSLGDALIAPRGASAMRYLNHLVTDPTGRTWPADNVQQVRSQAGQGVNAGQRLQCWVVVCLASIGMASP